MIIIFKLLKKEMVWSFWLMILILVFNVFNLIMLNWLSLNLFWYVFICLFIKKVDWLINKYVDFIDYFIYIILYNFLVVFEILNGKLRWKVY